MKTPWVNILILTFFLFQNTISAYAGSVSNQYKKFQSALNSGDITKAKALLDEWEQSNPKDPEMNFSRAVFFWGSAMSQLKESHEIYDMDQSAMLPDTISIFENLRVRNQYIYKDSGRGLEYFNLSIERMEKVLALYPDLAEAYLNMMEILNTKKEFKYSTWVALRMIEQCKKNNGKWIDYQ